MAATYPTLTVREEQERQELETFLRSGALGKAPNLQHFLEFVAQRHFAGEADQIKEYSIAVHALRRPETFDPQSDTIVRVTAHTLRKRLEQYYATEGREHAVQIHLPAGKYVLRFVHKEESSPEPVQIEADIASVSENVSAADLEQEKNAGQKVVSANKSSAFPGQHMRLWWLVAGGLLVGVIAYLVVRFGVPHGRTGSTSAERAFFVGRSTKGGGGDPLRSAGGQGAAMRLLFGTRSDPYTDSAGRVWSVDGNCEGGTAFAHADQEVRGTDDPGIFQQGREGRFHCRIPAAPGAYQLELLFADTAGDKVAARQIVFTINNGPNQALDVVDEAGGDNTAMGKVYVGVHPLEDGFVHLDFLSEGAFASAAVFTPTRSEAGEPTRMLAGPATLRDSAGRVWEPEQFFLSGRRTFHPDNLPKTSDPRLFEWERYGHFQYVIPVATGREYTVRMYFSEGWFGTSNGGPGGPGSRVFDVYCNGTTLLDDFDILKRQQNGAVVVVSRHVKPTASGMLNLHFEPVKNYPLINAIEIDPEIESGGEL